VHAAAVAAVVFSVEADVLGAERKLDRRVRGWWEAGRVVRRRRRL
jgi:hypothetical protein